jgi:hypothetical protein
MCLVDSSLRNLSRWNWDGDVIIRESVVPSSRPVVGQRSQRKQYDIDVREFLVTEDNAVMRRTLAEQIPIFLKGIGGDPGLFQSRSRGAFDYRADIISAFVAEKIRYRARKGQDPWQFPDETLFLRSGDCEDRAFLIAALLLASGVSAFNVRVALGKLRYSNPGKRSEVFDHAWVMYKAEAGDWNVLEPLNLGGTGGDPARSAPRFSGAREAPTAEYLPTFLFNQQHLWRVRGDEQTLDTVRRKEWKRLKPRFAGEVHQTILNRALIDVCPKWALEALNRNFRHIVPLGPIVDEVDNILVHAYNPLEHFDNGYIREGWELVRQRLVSFGQNNADLRSFACAAHAIGDFYAHSSYIHFAKLIDPGAKNGRAQPFDPEHPDAGLDSPPDYTASSTFDLTRDRFSVNPYYWKKSKADAAKAWAGQIISGRYAQKGDRHGIFERITNIPRDLTAKKDFYVRGALPHHNEIAVDQKRPDAGHQLYPEGNWGPTDRASYANQFRWRVNTACEHIRSAFLSCWKK